MPVPEGPDDLVPFTFRIPRSLVGDLDAWVEELNRVKRWPKVTRSDLIRGLLAWCVRERPDWERREAEPKNK
jgi:hypothetical protein